MRKILPLAMLVSTACGDIYNVTEDGENSAPHVQLNDCQDWANRSYECNPEAYVKYMNDWGVSIEDQIKHAEYECNKGNWFTTAPEYIECYEQNSCDYIKAGNCTHYIEEAGF